MVRRSAGLGEVSAELRRIDLVVHLDGTLQRFGQIVPAAVAALAAVAKIAPRYTRGRLRCFLLVLCPPDYPADRERARARALLERSGMPPFFEPPGKRILVEPSLAALARRGLAKEPGPAPQVAFVSALLEPVRSAAELGWVAWQLADEPAPGERRLLFQDLRRSVEEGLRVPTARPMSPETRRGSVLEVATGGFEASFERALAAARSDPGADWVYRDNGLLLYLEDEELAEQLSAAGAVMRFRNVRRADLVIPETMAPAGLRPPDGARAGEGAPWLALRRTCPPSARGRARAGRTPAPAQAWVRERLDAAPPDARIETLVPPASAPDARDAQVATWMTPAGLPEAPVVILISQGGPAARRFALEASRRIAARDPVCAVLHAWTPRVGADAVRSVQTALLAEERARLAGAVTLRVSEDLPGATVSAPSPALALFPGEPRDVELRETGETLAPPWEVSVNIDRLTPEREEALETYLCRLLDSQ